MPDIQLAT